ncbi:MAG: DUF559 domain-containing protein [Caulobacterales bacterium]|nr:DUF559 domain-containing protein [Caulobacterales bacterium]
MSEPEVLLWSRLKRLRERGYAFRRQFPFRGYFLDFACLSYRLVVEVDGVQHTDERQSEHDAVRDRILERHGFRVIRISAGSVRSSLADVMDQIVLALESSVRARGGGPADSDQPGRGSLTLAATPPVPPHQGRD